MYNIYIYIYVCIYTHTYYRSIVALNKMQNGYNHVKDWISYVFSRSGARRDGRTVRYFASDGSAFQGPTSYFNTWALEAGPNVIGPVVCLFVW